MSQAEGEGEGQGPAPCPICKRVPSGIGDFKVNLIDQSPDQDTLSWMQDPKRFGFKVGDQYGGVKNFEDMLGHATVFSGCMRCLAEKIDKDPLTRILFKAFWMTYDKLIEEKKSTIELAPNSKININI